MRCACGRRGDSTLRQLLASVDPHRGRRLRRGAGGRHRTGGRKSGRGHAVPVVARSTPFIHDRPAAEALAAWEEACAAAGCPERLDSVQVPLDDAVGRVTAEPSGPRPRRRVRPPRWTASRYAPRTRGGERDKRSDWTRRVRNRGHRRPDPRDFDAVSCARKCNTEGDAVDLRAAAAPYQHVRSIGEDVSAAELCCPPAPAAAVTWPLRVRPGRPELVVRRVARGGDPHRRRDPRGGIGARRGELPDTNSLMLRPRPRRWAPRCGATVCARRARSDRRRGARGSGSGRSRVVIAGSSAGRATTPPQSWRGRNARSARGGGTAGIRWYSRRAEATPFLGAPGYPVSASLTFDIFAAPLLSGCRARAARVTRRGARLAPARLDHGDGDWVRVRLGLSGASSWHPAPPAGPGYSPRWLRADGCSWCRPSSRDTTRARRSRCVCCAASARFGEPSWHGLARPVLDLAASTLREDNRDSRWRRRTSARRRADRAAGRALPCGRVAFARSGERRVHAAVCGAPASRPGGLCAARAPRAGLIVAPGNTHWTTSIEDVAERGLRYVQPPARGRHAGAARSRAVAARQFAGRHRGLEREEHTHLAVAAAVAAGRADCGLGVLAAARAFGLDFVPVAREPYGPRLRARPDPRSALDPARIRGMRRAVEELGGLRQHEMGRRTAEPRGPSVGHWCVRGGWGAAVAECSGSRCRSSAARARSNTARAQ